MTTTALTLSIRRGKEHSFIKARRREFLRKTSNFQEDSSGRPKLTLPEWLQRHMQPSLLTNKPTSVLQFHPLRKNQVVTRSQALMPKILRIFS